MHQWLLRERSVHCWQNGSRSLSWPCLWLFYLYFSFSFCLDLYWFVDLHSLVWSVSVDKILLNAKTFFASLHSFVFVIVFVLVFVIVFVFIFVFWQINSCAFSSIERGWGSAILSTTTLLSLATLCSSS